MKVSFPQTDVPIPRCENVEEKNIGRQVGFAMAGVSIGQTIVRELVQWARHL